MLLLRVAVLVWPGSSAGEPAAPWAAAVLRSGPAAREPAVAAQRAGIDRHRHRDPHHGPERPRAAEPAVDGRVPEQRRGQEEEADDR